MGRMDIMAIMGTIISAAITRISNVAIIAAVNSKNISIFVLPASLCTGVGPGTKFITSLLFMPSLPPFHAL